PSGERRDLHPFPTRRSSDLSWLAGGSQRGQVVCRVLAGEQETLQRQEQGILAGRGEDDMFTQGALLVAFVEIDKGLADLGTPGVDRKSTRLNSSHVKSSYAV